MLYHEPRPLARYDPLQGDGAVLFLHRLVSGSAAGHGYESHILEEVHKEESEGLEELHCAPFVPYYFIWRMQPVA